MDRFLPILPLPNWWNPGKMKPLAQDWVAKTSSPQKMETFGFQVASIVIKVVAVGDSSISESYHDSSSCSESASSRCEEVWTRSHADAAAKSRSLVVCVQKYSKSRIGRLTDPIDRRGTRYSGLGSSKNIAGHGAYRKQMSQEQEQDMNKIEDFQLITIR